MFGGQTLLNKEEATFNIAKTIGLISDTHVPKKAMCIPKRVFEIFEKVDYIIHAGDLVELSVADELEQIAPVLAVHGNMDGIETADAFPKINSMKIFDWKIAVVHDANLIDGLNNSNEFVQQNKFNVLVYGHTHISDIKWEGQTLYINPGSPTDTPSPVVKPSVALLKITKEVIIPQIVWI